MKEVLYLSEAQHFYVIPLPLYDVKSLRGARFYIV